MIPPVSVKVTGPWDALSTPSVTDRRLWFDVEHAMWSVEPHGAEGERLEAHVTESLRRVSVRNFWTPVRFRVHAMREVRRGLCVVVDVTVSVNERETGDAHGLVFRAGIDRHVALEELLLLKALRAIMVELVCAHEVDEALHFDGVRVDDPHAPGRRF